jgi:hypothetical protein
MKILPILLLGSSAGLVAVSAGYTDELHVKAKSVDHAKVCSLYGAGFYYLPETGLCMKVGGWVRSEASNGSMSWDAFNGNANNHTTSNMAPRASGYITTDVRNETGYGTVRAYLSVGVNHQ